MTSIAIGTHVGSLEITGLLGAGGMGEVYRARDAKLKREVAVKILPEAFARDADRVSRFQREAEVLASLNHPNIAAIYDLQQSADTRYWCWSSLRARPWPIGSTEDRFPLTRRSTSDAGSATRSKRRTRKASSIGI